MQKYIIAVGISLALGIIGTLSWKLNTALDKIVTLTEDLATCNTSNRNLTDSIIKQNTAIDKLKADKKKLDDYINSTPVHILVPDDINMTRSNCEDVSNLINFLRTSDL